MQERCIFLDQNNKAVRLRCMLHTDASSPLPAVMVCPGGAYVAISAPDAGVAERFYEQGFHAFVLEYSVGLHAAWPATMVDACRAMAKIRENAAQWRLAPDQVAVLGCSAGGGVAMCLATYWNDPDVLKAAGVTKAQARPDAMVGLFTTYRALPMWQDGVLTEFAPDCLGRIDDSTPPMFFAHTYEDQNGSMEYVFRAAAQLARRNTPAEVHTYTCGGHGALAHPSRTGPDGIREAGVEDWQPRCAEWLRDLFQRGLRSRPVHRAAYVPVMTDLVCAPAPQKPERLCFQSGLGDVAGSPAAMEVLCGYVPQLRGRPLNTLALQTTLGIWLQYGGHDPGADYPGYHRDPSPAAAECLRLLREILEKECTKCENC